MELYGFELVNWTELNPGCVPCAQPVLVLTMAGRMEGYVLPRPDQHHHLKPAGRLDFF